VRRAGFKIYSIHLPPPYSARGAEPEAVKEGFCFVAFLLNVIWALANRLWVQAAILFGLMAVLSGIGALIGLNVLGQAILILAVMAWAGMEGNDWRRAALNRRGWREAGIIAAESEDAALRRFGDLSALGSGPAVPSTPAPPPAPA
jgi:hypothetical protein